LYVGEDAITRSFPLRGSSATTAPQFDPSASRATRCAARSRVVTTVSPTIGLPESSSSCWSTRSESARSVPVSSPLRDFSRPARLREIVEYPTTAAVSAPCG
jgi:hypothetical protein